ncbi:MAG: DUF2029 domain-containing protein [Anaerolineae bacterium]|nr:DUF2029 domain-containing protein [Anaerolineae bacterium]
MSQKQNEEKKPQDETRPMAPYDAPESGGPIPEIDDGPPAVPVDDIQKAIVDAAQEGAPTEVEFDELPEPIPEVDEGPRPGPVDDIQEAIFEASQHGVSTDVEFEALPEPGSTFSQKIIRFAKKAVSPQEAEQPVAPPPEPAAEPPPPSSEPELGPVVTDFWLLLLLFLSFRLLTLLLLKPGGFIRDWSHFDFYLGIAGLSDYSLYPFLDFWLEWPPPIPWLMVGAYKLSLLLPPWPDDPRLWFVLILGAVFVLFEVGNFVLIYRLGRRVMPSADALKRVMWLYAGLFPPVYAMLGFFDGIALFFMLLTLDLLFSERRMLSAISAGVGFVVKIIPLLILPVALRWLWYQYRRNSREMGIELGLYAVTFGLTILILLSPFLVAGPEWMLAFVRSMLGRSAWETAWAVLDGYYGFGAVGGDRLNPAETSFAIHAAPRIAGWVWALVTLVFGLIYAFIFTRPANYNRPRNLTAFAGLTVVIFMLYSKGYSPQFLVYLLPFILLLFPNGRGLTYALVLTGLNILEQPVYFVLLPGTTWLLTFIVIARFVVIVILAGEFSLVIWGASQRLTFLFKPQQYAPLVLGALSILALLILTPVLLRAYADDRLANSPTRTLAEFMQAQAQNGADAASCGAGPDSLRLFLSDQTTYRQLYPHLHHDFDLRLVVGAPEGSQVPSPVQLLPDSGPAWVLPTGSQARSLANAATQKGRILETFDFADLGTATLYSFSADSVQTCAPIARFTGGIELVAHRIETGAGTVKIALFWRARSPQSQNLTVFTQLLDAEGRWIAGHDSVPQNGTLPVTTWAVNEVQLDSHSIELPANLPPGKYTVVVGFYNDIGARLSAFTSGGINYPNSSVPVGTLILP